MRILVVGAGAIGGYFGGRLLQAGRNVTFLVRAVRAAQLAAFGLKIASPSGDVMLPAPPTVLRDKIAGTFDLILLSCKAYDLGDAIDSLAPGVGRDTVVLPLLNGMNHLDVLDARLGSDRVLGGQCVISTTLDDQGTIRHLNDRHSLVFGQRDGPRSDRVRSIEAALSGARFDVRASGDIVQEMWEKWVMLATLAGSTCLLRASIGDIVATPDGERFILELLDECAAIAAGRGHPLTSALLDQVRKSLTESGSLLTASMLRDIERGARIEADHVLGDLLRRKQVDDSGQRGATILRMAYGHTKAYEARQARQEVA
jgi:2-dehydropantoate 2-reductase